MTGEKSITALICLFSVILFCIATTIPPSKVKSPLGTTFWPQLILTILFTSSAIHLVKLLLRKKDVERRLARETEQNRIKEEEEAGERRVFPLLLFGIFISFMYILCLSWVGFAIATPISMGIFMWITGYRKKVMLGVIPLGITVVFLLLFVKITYIPFPRGVGIFRSFSFLLY
jgi:hypothetical protein